MLRGSGASWPPQAATSSGTCGGWATRSSTEGRILVPMVTIDEVRAFASTLPRSSEGLVRGRVKFRIGRIVYLSLAKDGSTMGFAFPKELRHALVESEPDKFELPSESDLRYNWVHVRLAAIDVAEMRELVEDAWAFCVPKRVAEEYAASGATSELLARR